MLRKLAESRQQIQNCLSQNLSISFGTSSWWWTGQNNHSQLRTRPLRIRLQPGGPGRDIRANLNRTRPIMRIVDFERMPCPRRDTDRLRVRGRDDGVFALEGEDVAAAMFRVRSGNLRCERDLIW